MDADAAVHLERRARCYYRYGRRVCYNSWSYYGRWILTGIVILVFLLFLFCCLCTARRRRRRGRKPYYGTGWLAPQQKYDNGNQNYQMNQQAQQQNGGYAPPPAPPPAYGQPQYGQQQYGQQQQPYGNNYQYYQQPQQYSGTMPAEGGYYGQQQYPEAGVQSPANTYQPNK